MQNKQIINQHLLRADPLHLIEILTMHNSSISKCLIYHLNTSLYLLN